MRATRLRAARALISDPAKWIQGDSARDGGGYTVSPRSSGAVQFCAVGAMERVSFGEKSYGTLEHAAGLLGGFTTDYNDDPTRTHDDVMWMFDLAIALEEVGA